MTPNNNKTNFNNLLVLLGNALEFYDFMLYGVLASYLAMNFFPGKSSLALLLQVYGSFAVGYIARPIGAFYFGNLGDAKGRKNLLSYACIISGVATTLIGFLPSYNLIGIWATFGLIGLRLIQGFSLSGEQCGSLVFLSETNAKQTHIGCLYMTSIFSGVLLATGSCYLLFSLMSESSLARWGWRLPFIFSFPLCLVAYYIRQRIYETAEFVNMQKKKRAIKVPLAILWQKHKGSLVLPLLYAGIYASLTSFYMVAIPGYLKFLNIMSGKQIFLVESLGLAFVIVLMPILAKKVYKYGFLPRVAMNIGMAIIVAAMGIYCLSLEKFSMVFVAIMLLAIAIALISVLLVDVICSPFPTEVRCSGVAISFNLAVTVFTSSTPFVMLHFMQQYNTIFYMSYWYLGLGFVSLLALVNNKAVTTAA